MALEIARHDEEWGQIVIELDEANAPQTVRNFLRYVDEGYYNGTLFHRALAGFIVQGGGYAVLNELKKAGVRGPISNEAANGLKNVRGTIAMAHGKDPQSATTQFFINLKDNPALDFPGEHGWYCCVFGRVIAGLEIVDRIAGVPTQPNPQWPKENSQPIDPPLVKRAVRLGAQDTARPITPAGLQPSKPGIPPHGGPAATTRSP